MNDENEEKKYHAHVTGIEKGLNGLFAYAFCDELNESITFSFDKKVWQDTEKPEYDDSVVLWGLREKSKGWRATHARFRTPED